MTEIKKDQTGNDNQKGNQKPGNGQNTTMTDGNKASSVKEEETEEEETEEEETEGEETENTDDDNSANEENPSELETPVGEINENDKKQGNSSGKKASGG